MSKRESLYKSLFLFFSVLILCGCSEEIVETLVTVEGYILKIERDKILVADDITLDKFEEIKDKTMGDLGNENISLIYFSFDDLSNLQVGNKVMILFNGDIEQSYPAQARAREIEVIK